MLDVAGYNYSCVTYLYQVLQIYKIVESCLVKNPEHVQHKAAVKETHICKNLILFKYKLNLGNEIKLCF